MKARIALGILLVSASVWAPSVRSEDDEYPTAESSAADSAPLPAPATSPPAIEPTPAAEPSPAVTPSPAPTPSSAPSPSAARPAEHRAAAPANRLAFTLAASYGKSSFDNPATVVAGTPFMNWGVHLIAGYRLFSWFRLGVESTFRYTGHTGTLTSLDANVRGTRWSALAPWIGLELSGFRLSFAPQLLGDYNLINTASDGSVLRYAAVKGFRLELSHKLMSLGGGTLRIGIFTEQLYFGESWKNGVSQTISGSTISLRHYAIVVPYEF